MDVDPPSVTNTSTLGKSANADDVVSLGSPEDWGLNNRISGCDLYMHSFTVFSYSLTISAQSLATCTNVMAATRNFVALSSIVCIARCDNKFVLPASPIAENEWFLDSGASAHFTSFKSDFVSIT